MDELLELIRKWVQSEIDYAMVKDERDEEGYTNSHNDERDETDRAFQEFSEMFKMIMHRRKIE